MTGPSPHLSWRELACVNRLARPFGPVPRGAVVAVYPAGWRTSRAVHLAKTFEAIRARVGGPLVVNSAYRTELYNRTIGGAPSSQHVFGRALDLRHPSVSPPGLFAAIRDLQRAGQLPQLGGLGLYDSFVHIDVRPHEQLIAWVSGGGEVPGGRG